MIMSRMILNAQAGCRHGIYDAHQALWRTFADSPERRRDFVYREVPAPMRRRGDRCFLVVSARAPECGTGLWDIQTKAYVPRLQIGDRLHFSLRVNPVRKTRDAAKRQIRHALVQDVLHPVPKSERLPRLEVAQQAGLAWLAARQDRLGLALDMETCQVEAYQRWSFSKPAGGKPIVVAVMDVAGLATVTDPAALEQALFHGVGPAKAFGCGLLLVRRA